MLSITSTTKSSSNYIFYISRKWLVYITALSDALLALCHVLNFLIVSVLFAAQSQSSSCEYLIVNIIRYWYSLFLHNHNEILY